MEVGLGELRSAESCKAHSAASEGPKSTRQDVLPAWWVHWPWRGASEGVLGDLGVRPTRLRCDLRHCRDLVGFGEPSLCRVLDLVFAFQDGPMSMHSAIHLSAHLTTAYPAYIGSLGTVILILILGTNDHSFCAQVGNSPLLRHLPSYPPSTSSPSPRKARELRDPPLVCRITPHLPQLAGHSLSTAA